jgi:hypothetical protein
LSPTALKIGSPVKTDFTPPGALSKDTKKLISLTTPVGDKTPETRDPKNAKVTLKLSWPLKPFKPFKPKVALPPTQPPPAEAIKK